MTPSLSRYTPYVNSQSHDQQTGVLTVFTKVIVATRDARGAVTRLSILLTESYDCIPERVKCGGNHCQYPLTGNVHCGCTVKLDSAGGTRFFNSQLSQISTVGVRAQASCTTA